MHISKYHWGCFIWGYMHTIALFENKRVTKKEFESVKNYIKNILHIIPCHHCKVEYEKYLTTLPIITYQDFLDDKLILFRWTFLIHNKINEKLKKPTITYKQALNKWTNFKKDN
jgi:hypothetical protein